MSSKEVKVKLKETVSSVRELLETVKNATHEELSKRAPQATHALDRSYDKAAKTLSDSLRLIYKKTSKEQVELLEAYRSFLQKQVDFIENKIKALEKQDSSKIK